MKLSLLQQGGEDSDIRLGYGLLNIPASDPPEIVSALSKRAGFVKLSGV